MTDKELIKQEIERRKKVITSINTGVTNKGDQFVYGQLSAYKGLSDFIDSLPEKHNEDLEKELDNFLKDPAFSKLINRNAGIVLAHHFAEWQRKKDQETIELAEDHAMLAGMEKMREEMMKDAVECIWGSRATSSFMSNFPNIECGDKVKIIIVKEDRIC